MKRLVATAFALALAAATAGTAFADSHAKPNFPMKADAFQQHVDQRIARARAKMEEQLKKDAKPEAEARAIRAKFDAAVTKVNEATKKATADGTVTADEAKEVRRVSRELHPQGHHPHHR
jgi:hypothetical protein